MQLLPDSNQLSVKTNYAFYFTISSDLPRGSYVEISFPQDYFTNLSDVYCSPIKTAGLATTCSVPDSSEANYDSVTGTEISFENVIRIQGSFQVADIPANTEIAFLLHDVTNPDASIEGDSSSATFGIKTLSPEGYPIDASDNLNFNIGCEFPCETCTGEQTACITCLTLDNGTKLNFFEKEQTCLVECPFGYRQNNLSECEQCDIQCDSCQQGKDFCDICNQDSGVRYINKELGNCMAECPTGTYANEAELICEPCINGCSTCLSQDYCLSCTIDSYFLENQCLSECPATSIKFEIETLQECELCLEPCYSCEGATDNCLTCITGFYFHENQCLDECPDGYQVDEN